MLHISAWDNTESRSPCRVTSDETHNAMSLKSGAKSVLSVAIDATGRVARLRKSLVDVSSRDRKCCLLAPAWQGSLGDEAVVTGACQHLKADQWTHVTLMGFDREEPWKTIAAIDERISVHDFFKSGGWPERLRLIGQLAEIDEFYLLGTDMLDGHYTEWHTLGLLTIATQAARSGMPTNVVGFSLKEQPKISAIDGLRRISTLRNVKMCLRDAVSMSRFEQSVGARANLTADVAFLMKPDPAQHPVRSWIESRRFEGRLLIGLNICSHIYDAFDANDQGRLLSSAVACVSRIAQEYGPTGVVLIPHDIRAEFTDIPICEALEERLRGNPRVDAVVLSSPYSAALVKSIVSGLDFVLSSRMHLAIASLGMGVPVGCITYQGKFEGLFQHFGLEGCTISPEEALNAEDLSRFASNLAARRDDIKKTIVAVLPGVAELARANFEMPR